MRIAHVVCSYPPYYGGMGNVVLQTVSELARRGHDVEVITPTFQEKLPQTESDYEPEIQEQIEYAKFLKPSIQYGKAARLPQVNKELDNFDLVHLHYPFFGTANLVRKWKLRNPDKPLVITYHMDTRSPGWKGLIFKYYSKYWMPKILNSADLIIASSFDYIEHSGAVDHFHKFRNKWVELPFGVDINRFRPRVGKPDALFLRHDLDPDIPLVLFVGGMDTAHYFKGVPVLLESLLLFKKSGVEMQAVFVGDGELRHDFELRAKSFGLGKSVRFVGRVSNEELPYYYNMANLTVLPSIHQGEAFGMVLLESMASGVPIIASDLPGVRTVAADGGVVFNPGDSRDLADKIVEYFSEEVNHLTFVQDIRTIAEIKYSWVPIVDYLEILYQDLVEV
ncbi:MAG: hypothetical protein COX81_02020 [Candidatus Magasanikbacteria bacterium CG_4_10_14_0_2_um_filter_37_12]|uniref:Glycosyltransferase family 1 protein n=1 Tax=Candidatus Magasanikbacteria bacterium CG_4_10_14_0_2_um_filter_37_12 TaxID=1974637 RepID=A0A2M7V8D6_9BACT|nr:MAG: hypothetical protein COX81_02020 [Candidatus Magasanikbacteria bacterium CG_4_10_14_0_2_um_filter_37_12]